MIRSAAPARRKGLIPSTGSHQKFVDPANQGINSACLDPFPSRFDGYRP